MARSHKRKRRIPPVSPPTKSLRFISIATICFVSFIAFAVLCSALSHHQRNTPQNNNNNRLKKKMTTTKVRFDTPEEIPDDIVKSLDAILVLGGGVPLSLEEPPLFVQKRCDDAAKIVQRYTEIFNRNNLPILTLSAGTAHLPQLLSGDGLPIWEATASAAYLIKHYSPDTIDKSQVFAETTSYDTISNAFFARTSFTDITGWRRLLIITNEFHMDRSQAIFDWIFGIPDNNKGSSSNYQLYYLAPPNTGLTDEAVQARKQREAKSQKNVQEILAPKYQTIKGVWTFLTQEHSLYTAHKLVERGRAKTEETATSEENQALKESYGLNNKGK
ncbi:DUF218 domain [Seminavis robusta]|uniref:DUF218 domain n=1 Tax=Seminavis robusta TaxID=568900 RepID=A0A9N8EUH2_9STRA|nr:DUF218 domain [Seminavis robusta]|eukprot:Sro1607_g285630.1 DUF218 domain (331) ;mRNA; r:18768-19879